MPIHGYPGNVITANPTAPTVSSASGVWTTEQQLINQSAGNWPMAATQVSLSTRFNSADSAYLSRTPATASNRDTWTLSFWIKRTNLGEQYIFSVADGSASGFEMRFTSGDALRVNDYNPGVTDYIFLITSQLFRDVGAWYHIVLAVDTTQATNTNRVKIYVNGSQVTAFSSTTYPNQNQDTAVNTAKQHRFGAAPSSTPPTTFGNFYLAEVNFIDGLALTPAYFGFNDSNTGAWTPKQYTGAYGTNGFFLPFNVETVSFSADFLVIAGGGGGSTGGAEGGGGAGGYRTSAGTSGGGASAESALTLTTSTTYTVTVGAGGGGATNGSNSVFSTVTSTGGGAGAASGGSGGGSFSGAGGSGTANQGYAGGSGNGFSAGGGGGAGAVGVNGTGGASGNGGAGVASSITGSSVTRAGGGGGGGRTDSSGSTAGAGGTGGGGAGNASGTGTSGTANTGGGGGGRGFPTTGTGPGSGGSGVVIIKIPDSRTANFSSGVTSSLSTAVSGYKIYTVTATSTTSETVTFS